MFSTIHQNLKKIFQPNGIFEVRYNGKRLASNVSVAVMNFIFLFVMIFIVIAIMLNISGLDVITSLSAAGSALANVGPGLGDVIGPKGTYQSLNDASKWILIFAMLIGRLELLTVLVLFTPQFWRA